MTRLFAVVMLSFTACMSSNPTLEEPWLGDEPMSQKETVEFLRGRADTGDIGSDEADRLERFSEEANKPPEETMLYMTRFLGIYGFLVTSVLESPFGGLIRAGPKSFLSTPKKPV